MTARFGIALSQAAGSLQFLADGAWTKRSHVGQAAQNGLNVRADPGGSKASRGRKVMPLKANGASSGPTPRTPTAPKATAGSWGHAVGNLAARGQAVTQAAATPTRRWTPWQKTLKHEGMISAPTIVEAVEIGLPDDRHGRSCRCARRRQAQPAKRRRRPVLHAVLRRRGAARGHAELWDHYATHLTDPDTRALGQLVSTIVDPQAQAAYPANMAGVARVTSRGETFEAFVEVPKGEPGNFLDESEFLEKFNTLCGPYMSKDAMDRFARGLLTLDQANSVSSVLGFGQAG